MAKHHYDLSNGFIKATRVGVESSETQRALIGVFDTEEQTVAKLVIAVDEFLKFDISDNEVCEIHKRFKKILKEEKKNRKNK